MKIHDLNMLRIRAREWLTMLGYRNTPKDPGDRLKTDAEYALALDACRRAEADYEAELLRLTSPELMAIAGISGMTSTVRGQAAPTSPRP
jgi:hypothetical protein